MNILNATKRYEAWVGQHTQLVAPDLRLKHRQMAESAFFFLRATFYRWMQVWPRICPDLNRVPRVLAVGDLHVENFGTWRDLEGRLVWGINDFDEASTNPYTVDLVRLAASALLAVQGGHLAMRAKDAIEAILEGYRGSLEEGGRPFVLGENHPWLRQIAESKLRDPVRFWQRMDGLPTLRGPIPAAARQALERLLPERRLKYRLARRVAGLGSLGHMRFVAIAEWRGGLVAREAKALVSSATHWLSPGHTPAEILYSRVLRRAVRCPDPYVQLRGPWIIRRLSPHCSRVELDALGKSRGELRLLEAMGWETANIHLGSPRQRTNILKDLRRRKGNWLARAAAAMVQTMERDWRNWRKQQRP